MMARSVTLLFTILFLLIGQNVWTQEKGLEISSKKRSRVKFLKENRRIKVFTEDGKKYKGRFSVVDDKTINIKGTDIKLEEIYLIRKKDLGLSIVKGAIFAIGTVAIIGGASTPSGIGAVIVTFMGAGINIMALTIPEIAIGSLDKDRWSYKIIN